MMLKPLGQPSCCGPAQAQYTHEINVYWLKIAVSSNNESFIDWLGWHYSEDYRLPLIENRLSGVRTTAEFHVHIADWQNDAEGRHSVTGPDDSEHLSRSSGHPQAYMERVITRTAKRHLTPLQVMHGGVVARDGRAILLPARPNSGKSMLVAALVFSGFEYLTDEVAVFTRESRFLPFPKGITLMSSGWQAIAALFPQASEHVYAPVHNEDLRHLAAPHDSSSATTGYDLDFIVLPRYAPGEATSLKPIPRSEALPRLLEQSLNLSILGKQGYDTIIEMVKRARCYALTTNDLIASVGLLEALLDGDISG